MQRGVPAALAAFAPASAPASSAGCKPGKLAQQQASNDQVKEFAEQAALKELQNAKGEQFDRAYMAQMVKHREDAHAGARGRASAGASAVIRANGTVRITTRPLQQICAEEAGIAGGVLRRRALEGDALCPAAGAGCAARSAVVPLADEQAVPGEFAAAHDGLGAPAIRAWALRRQDA